MKYFWISEKFNNKKLGEYLIYPPILFDFEASEILSYSLWYHTIVVTTDGIAHVIGDNRQGKISGSLPKEEIQHFTDIELKNENGQSLTVASALYGQHYSLYMVSSSNNLYKNQLAYSHKKSIRHIRLY